MADQPRDTDEAYPDPQPVGGSAPPRTPRWVQAFGVIAIILGLLVAVQLLLGVQHGPGMHAPPSDAGSQAPTASAPEPATIRPSSAAG